MADPHDPSFPRRVRRAVPPLSDGTWLAILLVMVFLGGVLVGVTLSLSQGAAAERDRALQQRLSAVESRLRRIEQQAGKGL